MTSSSCADHTRLCLQAHQLFPQTCARCRMHLRQCCCICCGGQGRVHGRCGCRLQHARGYALPKFDTSCKNFARLHSEHRKSAPRANSSALSATFDLLSVAVGMSTSSANQGRHCGMGQRRRSWWWCGIHPGKGQIAASLCSAWC